MEVDYKPAYETIKQVACSIGLDPDKIYTHIFEPEKEKEPLEERVVDTFEEEMERRGISF